MGLNIFEKICKSHDIDLDNETLSICPDQVLIHDGTGTSVFLQLEAIGVTKIKPLTVVYVDHNTLQVGFFNPDDHKYLKGMAAKLGAVFSRPGNGICHQVHLENFAKPGHILLGSDSHTLTAGGLASLAVGAGGLDVAAALAGEPYYLARPKVIGIYLEGTLPPWTSAKDIILYLLGEISVKGGIGCVLEYFGPGVEQLSVYDRATICNMGAETGATSSIFPSDGQSCAFLKRLGREGDFAKCEPDDDACYDRIIEINLSRLEPMVALPHSPDNVKPVSQVVGTPVQQICIGSCTNSSLKDLTLAARLLKDNCVHPDTVLTVSAGSRRALTAVTESNDLISLIKSGARILESTCGPCNGIGQSPESNANTLRTHNRNFQGRCGTQDAHSYLCSVEVAAASALNGAITDPRHLGKPPAIESPTTIPDFPDLFIWPSPDPGAVEVVKGPNIKPIPLGQPPVEQFKAPVALKLGDNVTTDDIIPGGAKMLSLRSNVPESVPYIFQRVDPEFAARLNEYAPMWIVVAGENYGQGSSREHAVMVPMFAGLRVVIAKSFARIHRQNLINFGVVPLVLENKDDYELLCSDDLLRIDDFRNQLLEGKVIIENIDKVRFVTAVTEFNERERCLILNGGLLAYLRGKYRDNIQYQ